MVMSHACSSKGKSEQPYARAVSAMGTSPLVQALGSTGRGELSLSAPGRGPRRNRSRAPSFHFPASARPARAPRPIGSLPAKTWPQPLCHVLPTVLASCTGLWSAFCHEAKHAELGQWARGLKPDSFSTQLETSVARLCAGTGSRECCPQHLGPECEGDGLVWILFWFFSGLQTSFFPAQRHWTVVAASATLQSAAAMAAALVLHNEVTSVLTTLLWAPMVLADQDQVWEALGFLSPGL